MTAYIHEGGDGRKIEYRAASGSLGECRLLSPQGNPLPSWDWGPVSERHWRVLREMGSDIPDLLLGEAA